MLTKCIYSEALLAHLNHNSHKILRNGHNITASLFENNWLSWQDPNIIADIGARCLVYRNGMYQCHLPTFETTTWNNDRSFHTSVSTEMVFITVTCQPSKGCFEWRETTTEALRHQRRWPLASGLVLVETSIFSPKIMMVMICRSQVLTDDQRWDLVKVSVGQLLLGSVRSGSGS